MRENRDFVVPVNILTTFARAPFSWAARHTTVCLDMKLNKKYLMQQSLKKKRGNWHMYHRRPQLDNCSSYKMCDNLSICDRFFEYQT